jgi:hypothetical protein
VGYKLNTTVSEATVKKAYYEHHFCTSWKYYLQVTHYQKVQKGKEFLETACGVSGEGLREGLEFDHV